MNKIKRVSIFFRIFFQALFIVLPLLLIFAWIHSPESLVMMGGMINMNFVPQAYVHSILHTLTLSDRLLGFSLSVIPASIQLYILYSLIQLFKLYEHSKIFSIQNVKYIRNIGYALLLGQCINPFYESMMGIILTWHNPPGHRFAVITFDQTNISVIIIALLTILISWIMAEGCKLQEEQQLTI